MTHAVRARKERGAKIVVIDIYDNATMKQADMGLILKPGTDGALACAVMHVLFRDGMADRAYLEKYTDDPHGPRSASQRQDAGMGGRDHRPFRSPRSRPSRVWSARRSAPSSASATALPASATARSTCTPRCRSPRSPAAGSMRAAAPSTRIPASSSSTRACSKARRLRDPDIRYLDHSRIGPVLMNAPDALYGGPPVTAMLIQNTNPANVAPEQRLVKQGFPARRPLHLRARAVHDRHGEARRRRAAGDHVPRARRHLSRRRQPAHQSRAEADRPAGRAAHQPFRHRGTGQAPRRRRTCRASA